MRDAIRRLSARSEFLLVAGIAFSYYIVTSALLLAFRINRYELTSGRALRGVLVEGVILALVMTILLVRGWTSEQLGFRFSVAAAVGGVLLFVAYTLLYWITATLVVTIYPAARGIHAFEFIITAAPTTMLLFIVMNSFFEEVIVTAYVVSAFTSQGLALSITVSTLLRFLYHLYQGPIASISILPLGVLFGIVYWRWRNVWPLIIAHTITNIFSFALTR